MRLLRKYIDNRGSALFMVISTMTALMISCMAMYFSVISSRSTQYAIFNQQQSKQSATSVNDALVAGMMDGTLSSLTNAMTNLKEGEKLSAGANGFKELGLATGAESDLNLGAYTVHITRLPNETVGGVEKMVFDISTTAVVNGSNTVYHTILYYESTGGVGGTAPTQVFAATGYVPNDVFLDGGVFKTDVFFDNEMTIVNAYGQKNMEVHGNLSTGGSLRVNKYLIPTKERPLTFAIRGDFYNNQNNPMEFSASSRSTVLIGGDCNLNDANGFKNANVYVLGDLIVKAGIGFNEQNVDYFVGGNVILEPINNQWVTNGGNWISLNHIFCNKSADTSKNPNGGFSSGLLDNKLTNGIGKTILSWDAKVAAEVANGNKEFLSVSEMIDELETRTKTNTYYKWVINDSNPSGDKYVAELDESKNTCVKKKLKFSQDTYNNGTVYPNPISTVELNYADEHGCIIEDVTCEKGNAGITDLAIIIDTGEDPDNVYTIRVKANRDYDNDGKNETFSWYPYYDSSSSCNLTILVKGRGSVVVDIPKGVTYQDMTNVHFMHYGWFLLGGGKESTKTVTTGPGESKTLKIYSQGDVTSGNADKNFVKFIHTECKDSDGCEYVETDSTKKCAACGTQMTNVSCKTHGNLNAYCSKCHPEKVKKHAGECANHVARDVIDTELAKEANKDLKKKMEDSKGKVIYPNTNIFLVSCDESASIRLSVMQDGSLVIQNGFFGYIYAPYMTFKAYGDGSGGGYVRMMGGMTVSDYIIDQSMSMIACWPDKMPEDLMSDECKQNAMEGLASKGWKISLKAH